MKKGYYHSIIVGFFFLILLPLVLMPFMKNRPAENRQLAERPLLWENGGFNSTFPEEMDAYFQDHFAGRTQMIDLYARMVAGVFGQSANEKVVLGKEGWLFFQDTVKDFEGTSTLSPSEMDRLIATLERVNFLLERRGQRFIIVIPPNKNSIYGEYMPKSYVRAEGPSNYDRLLQAKTLPILDLRNILENAPGQTYYQTDTHWNAYGARLAANAMLEEIGKRTGIVPNQFPMEDSALLRPENIKGDLAQMLYPYWTPLETESSYVDIPQSFRTVGRYHGPEDPQITTIQEGGLPLSLYVLRDSFFNALVPYFSDTFQNVYYTRQMPLSFETDKAKTADLVILEITERRLFELLEMEPDIDGFIQE